MVQNFPLLRRMIRLFQSLEQGSPNSFSCLLHSSGRDQPFGECHRNHGADQREGQQLRAAACLGPFPLSAPALHAAQRHRGPSRHGGILQLRKGFFYRKVFTRASRGPGKGGAPQAADCLTGMCWEPAAGQLCTVLRGCPLHLALRHAT